MQILVDAFHRHFVRLGGLENPDAVLGRRGDGRLPAAQEINGSLAFWVISRVAMEVWVRLGPMTARQSFVLGQLGGVEPGLGYVAFVVINDQLQGMPIDAPLGVDCLGHHLQGIAFGLP